MKTTQVDIWKYMDGEDMPTLTKAMFYAESFEAGILPVQLHEDVTRALAQLPPDEARSMRRKFRKLWKKQRKEDVRKVRGSKKQIKKKIKVRDADRTFGSPECRPLGFQAKSRRIAVFTKIMEKVEPAVDKVMSKLPSGQ